jgi:hypothetical protein
MADERISDMPSAGSVADADVTPIVQSGINKKSAFSVIKAYLTTAFNLLYVPLARTVNSKALSSNITLGLASSDFANQGTTTTVLHGNASGNPSFDAVSLANDVTGNLAVSHLNSGTNADATHFWRGDGSWQVPTSGITPAALTKTDDTNVTATLGGTPATALLQSTSITLGWTGTLASGRGGTGNGFTKFSGPTTSEKTFTLPDSSVTILYSGGALGTPSSGTLTNATGLPIAGLVASTSTAIGVGSIELGAASDTTIARVSAGLVSIEGSNVATMAAAQVFTGQNKFNNFIDVNNAITASGNAATVPVTFKLNTITNNSAATLTITMATASAVDGQLTLVRILDFSGVAQTITWVNTENSTVTAPATSNGSTTLPLTVGLQYNSATTKWRVIATG